MNQPSTTETEVNELDQKELDSLFKILAERGHKERQSAIEGKAVQPIDDAGTQTSD